VRGGGRFHHVEEVDGGIWHPEEDEEEDGEVKVVVSGESGFKQRAEAEQVVGRWRLAERYYVVA